MTRQTDVFGSGSKLICGALGAAPTSGRQAHVITRQDGTVLPKLAFRVDELKHVLGLGATKIRELIAKQELGSIREGTAVLVTLDQVQAYLRRKEKLSGWLG